MQKTCKCKASKVVCEDASRFGKIPLPVVPITAHFLFCNASNSATRREIVVLPLVPVTARIRAAFTGDVACKYCFCH